MDHNISAFKPALQAAFQSALVHLESLESQSVAATATLSELRSRLAKPLNDQSLDPEDVVRDLVRDTQGGLVGSAGGRFSAWAVGGSVPAALAADWLASAWDQNAGLYASGPSAAVAEEVAGAWLKDLLGIPASASFAFVSGCQMAHVTCLAAAGHALLPHISILTLPCESSDGLHHQYPQGFERDEDAPEGDTQWVRNKTGHFSSPSMPR